MNASNFQLIDLTQQGRQVFSFKLRGAYNKIASLTAEQRAAGIVACSAGNHAQGVAMSCTQLGVDGIIVMPVATPKIKVDGVRCWHAGARTPTATSSHRNSHNQRQNRRCCHRLRCRCSCRCTL